MFVNVTNMFLEIKSRTCILLIVIVIQLFMRIVDCDPAIFKTSSQQSSSSPDSTSATPSASQILPDLLSGKTNRCATTLCFLPLSLADHHEAGQHPYLIAVCLRFLCPRPQESTAEQSRDGNERRASERLMVIDLGVPFRPRFLAQRLSASRGRAEQSRREAGESAKRFPF